MKSLVLWKGPGAVARAYACVRLNGTTCDANACVFLKAVGARSSTVLAVFLPARPECWAPWPPLRVDIKLDYVMTLWLADAQRRSGATTREER